jgi:hypothetical protein
MNRELQFQFRGILTARDASDYREFEEELNGQTLLRSRVENLRFIFPGAWAVFILHKFSILNSQFSILNSKCEHRSLVADLRCRLAWHILTRKNQTISRAFS